MERARLAPTAAAGGAAAHTRRPVPGGPASVLGLQRRLGNRNVAAALAPRPQPAPPAAGLAVQRHASWEHKMLGDVDPDVLEVIASGRDAAKSATKTVAVNGRTIGTTTVVHAIDQEIRRLQYFRTSPPTGAGQADAAKLAKQDFSDRLKDALAVKDPSAKS